MKGYRTFYRPSIITWSLRCLGSYEQKVLAYFDALNENENWADVLKIVRSSIERTLDANIRLKLSQRAQFTQKQLKNK